MAAADLGTSTDSVYRWIRKTTNEQIARETHRLPSNGRMVPKLVVDVIALGRHAGKITSGRPPAAR